MPYRKRADAPWYFDVAGMAIAILAPDELWNWVIPHLPRIGAPTADTQAFCEAGPPSVNIPELLLLAVGLRFGVTRNAVLGNVDLGTAIRAVVDERLFEQFCEEYVELSENCIEDFTDHPYTHQVYDPWESPGYPVEEGVTSLQIECTLIPTSGHPDMHCHLYFGPSYVTELSAIEGGLLHELGQQKNYPLPPPGTYDKYVFVTNGVGGRYTVRQCGVGPGWVPYEADPITPPPGLVPPRSGTYETIADLGRELDAQEFKLDILMEMVRWLAQQQVVAPLILDPPTLAGPGVEVDVDGWAGAIVTCEGVPSAWSLDYGTPQRFHGVGWVSLGNPAAWSPPVPIEHSPMILYPFPVGTTRARVNTTLPVSATLTKLTEPK